MSYQAKTDWKYGEVVDEGDLNRIEQGIKDAHDGLDNIESTAEATSIADAGGLFESDNVEGALAETAQKVKTHLADNAMHVTPTDRTKWDAAETNAKNYAINLNTVKIKDERSVNSPPIFYNTGFITSEFKNKTTIGLPSGVTGTYCTVLTDGRFTNNTGGKVTQLALVDGNRQFTRENVNDNTWGPWKEVGNAPGSYELIEKTTVSGSSGGKANITIPAGYKKFKLVVDLQHSGNIGGGDILLTFDNKVTNYETGIFDLIFGEHKRSTVTTSIVIPRGIAYWGGSSGGYQRAITTVEFIYEPSNSSYLPVTILTEIENRVSVGAGSVWTQKVLPKTLQIASSYQGFTGTMEIYGVRV